MYTKPLPPAERLNHLFTYDPDIGALRWENPTHHRCKHGDLIHTSHGYGVVTIDKQTYLQHRVIWKMMTGEDPPEGKVIDHKDGNPSNNAWANLQLLTNSQNILRAEYTRAPFMVAQQRPDGRWQARVQFSFPGKHPQQHVAVVDTREEALSIDPQSIPYRPANRQKEPRVRRTPSGRYECRVYIPGKGRVHVGTFDTEQQAVQAGWGRLSDT